ncbi:MAG: cytochrome ubiquinol oxidase subunit I [Thermoanaerobaculia bacterium]
MNDVLFARSQMAMSLGFHIVFAVIGIAMPLLMVIAEVLWRRTGDEEYLDLAKNWAKGTTVLFAVGAVSGTVLSFELGLLFPTFMRHAGPVIVMPFSLEGFAFFTEAIFLGLYLYGWNRLSGPMHLFAGVMVAISGLASAVFVLIANAWMNAPVGFRIENGEFVDIDPFRAMLTPFALHTITHMVAAAYMATGFAVAGIHAWSFLTDRGNGFHRKAMTIALAVAIPFTLAQPLIGDFAGKQVAKHQPLKLAAMERLEKTEEGAALRIGPIEIPGLLAFISYGDFNATVRGLEEWPREDWPHPMVSWSFKLMVALGMWMALVAAFALFLLARKKPWTSNRWLLRALVISAPMGFIAIEVGWVVTEVGRQPWVIYEIMRTVDSVTPMPGLVIPFTLFSLIYIGLSITTIAILRTQIRGTLVPAVDDGEVP